MNICTFGTCHMRVSYSATKNELIAPQTPPSCKDKPLMYSQVVTQAVVHHPLDQFVVLLAHMDIAPSVRHAASYLALSLERGVSGTLGALAQIVEAVRDVSLLVRRLCTDGRIDGPVEAPVAQIPHYHVQAVKLVERGDAIAVGRGIGFDMVRARKSGRINVGNVNETTTSYIQLGIL
jgi:hypothetical protein